MRKIINIINFIRGIEPRQNIDLIQPIKEQIALMKQYRLKGTFLIQYDALIDHSFTDILTALDLEQFEIGVWFEVVQPQCEQAGIQWKGRYPWDWHSNCAFSIGYTPAEREKLIDIHFETVKSVFGYYPKSIGSWAFDAHTLRYAHEKYGLHAACNCKDQSGTDGYTLWGGYYGQGYYPSKYNSYTPAQTVENQINVPIFRMLGSDPIVQYDAGADFNQPTVVGMQAVYTLEPVYIHDGGGGSPSWVDWYFSQNFCGNGISFAYTQAGQENSFGWEEMQGGLTYQFRKISEMLQKGEIEVEKLCESGHWYQQTYQETPPSTITALTDWGDRNRCSIWYNCKNYRMNLYAEEGRFWIRDIHLFRENYQETYLNEVCTRSDVTFDNLPLVDGYHFSGSGVRAGLYIESSDKIKEAGVGMAYEKVEYRELGNAAEVIFNTAELGEVMFVMTETGFSVKVPKNAPFVMVPVFNPNAKGIPTFKKVSDQELELCHKDFFYEISLDMGVVTEEINFQSEKDSISFVLSE